MREVKRSRVVDSGILEMGARSKNLLRLFSEVSSWNAGLCVIAKTTSTFWNVLSTPSPRFLSKRLSGGLSCCTAVSSGVIVGLNQ